MKKRLKNIAIQLAALEKEAQTQATLSQEIMGKMMALTKGLSIHDMIEIDLYIQEKNLLTK